MWSKFPTLGNVYSHDGSAALPTDSGRTVLHVLVMLPESKCLCPVELLTFLLDTSQASFTSLDVLFFFHCDIVLWRASKLVVVEKGAVAAIQNIQFRITQCWVSMGVDGSISMTNKLRPVL